MSNSFTLLTKADYLARLAKDINSTKAGDRVAVATFSFEPKEKPIAELMRALCNAASRGVQVQLAVDAFTFLASNTLLPGPIWALPTLKQPLTKSYRDKLDILLALAANGGHYAITNMPKRPFSVIPGGRSHIKAAIINDSVYLGGCNLERPLDIDIMVEFSDKTAADWIYHNLTQLVQKKNTRIAFGDKDLSLKLDDTTSLFIDVGMRGQSQILDEAFKLIDSAEKWIFMTCQYFPGGKTAKHLLAAHKRGVKVELAYNHPSIHGKVESVGHHLYNYREKTRLPEGFFSGPFADSKQKIHAKLITTDKGVMFGSHNFVGQGVTLGTAEIALLSSDSNLSKRLVDSLKRQLDQIDNGKR